MLELPYCNGDMFQLFLDEFSLRKTKILKVLILDNGAFHKVKKLKIPDNIILIFQPPYSPEVNASENIWAAYKRAFTNKLHGNLEEISKFIIDFTRKLSKQTIISTTAFKYVKPYLNWTV